MSQHTNAPNPSGTTDDLKAILADLHLLSAQELLKVIRKGIPIADPETGEVHYAPAPAAYFAQVMALLKHNNIQAPASGKARKTLDALGEAAGDPNVPDAPGNLLPFPARR